MKAGELRDKLRGLGSRRVEYEEVGEKLEAEALELLQAAKAHPEVSVAEAARLAAFKRRATAYDLLERGGNGARERQ